MVISFEEKDRAAIEANGITIIEFKRILYKMADWIKRAVEWCRRYGLEFDRVNENLPEMIEQWGGESRKVFADVYIDDKAVNKPQYCIPYKEV